MSLIGGRRRGLWAGVQRLGLRVVSWIYGAGAGARNRLYDLGWKASHAVSVPVVSVGNLTLGGTGKTPCVEYLARFYRQHHLRVAILSRGYGSQAGRNDEALVLEENLADVPHLQGPDRFSLASAAVEELDSELLILDDGFQHRRLKRDLDIVLVDATEPWGLGYLFPRGLLREAPHGLQRAQVVMLTRCDQVGRAGLEKLEEEVRRHAPAVLVVRSSHQPAAWVNAEHAERSLEALSGRPVAAFCGIGNPLAFRKTLEALGHAVADFRIFPDHHSYSRDDVEDLRNWARRQPAEAFLATTQKDLVKVRLTGLSGHELWALQIRLHVDRCEEELHKRLLDVLCSRRPQAAV